MSEGSDSRAAELVKRLVADMLRQLDSLDMVAKLAGAEPWPRDDALFSDARRFLNDVAPGWDDLDA